MSSLTSGLLSLACVAWQAPPQAGPSASPVATAPAPSAAPVAVPDNYVLAAANDEVVTLRDVMLEWRLQGRGIQGPIDAEHRPAPNRDEQHQLAKTIVKNRLWLAHAKSYPLWAEYVTERMLNDAGKERFGALWDDRTLPADERKLLRKRNEEIFAKFVILGNDPEFRRSDYARPEEVRRYFETHPELHHANGTASLGRVMLGRAIYGEGTDALAQKIRARALEKGSLRDAATELAPGSYAEQKELPIEGETSLRDDILEFARKSSPGDLSPPFSGSSSVTLYCLLGRVEGRDVTFEERASAIQERLEESRQRTRQESYFIEKILPEAYFGPPDLFDEELEAFGLRRVPVASKSDKPAKGQSP